MDVCIRSIEGSYNRIIIYKDLLYLCGFYVIDVFDKHLNLIKTIDVVDKKDVHCSVIFNDLMYCSCWGGVICVLNKNGYIGEIGSHKDYTPCILVYNGLLYSGSIDRTICVWDGEKRIKKLQNTFKIYSMVVYNELLYVGCGKGFLKVWSKEHVNIKNIKIHTKKIECLIVYNNLLYSGGADKIICVWNSNNKCIKTLDICNDEVSHFTIHNNLLYAGDISGKIYVFDVYNQCIRILDAHTDTIGHSAIYNNLLYTNEWHGDIKIWGEYYPHHRNKLPSIQIDKIIDWEDVWKFAGIHKDISLTFIRELLR